MSHGQTSSVRREGRRQHPCNLQFIHQQLRCDGSQASNVKREGDSPLEPPSFSNSEISTALPVIRSTGPIRRPSPLGNLDRFQFDVDADLFAHETSRPSPTRHSRSSPNPAVDLGVGAEAVACRAPRALGITLVLHISTAGFVTPAMVNRPSASLRCRRDRNLGALEGDRGTSRHSGVRRAQVTVALRILSVDARRVDGDVDGRVAGLAGSGRWCRPTSQRHRAP